MQAQTTFTGDYSLSKEKSSTVEQINSIPNALNITTGKAIRKWYKEQAGQRPKKVVGQIATRTDFYRRELFTIVKSMFKIECSLDWDIDYILNVLTHRGYIVISTTPAGVLPIEGSLTGLNYIGLPTEAVMASPLLGNWRNTIGVDCEIIYLERDINRMYYTFVRLVDIFAQRLASADAAVDVNLMNSKLGYVAEAETKAQADSIKKAFDEISDGNPLVVYRQNSLSSDGLKLFFGSVKNNYVADLVQDTKRTIMNEFLTLLGINNANTDKKERLVVSEVDSNNVELSANVDIWRENLDRNNKKVKRTFPGLEWNIELRYDIEKMADQAMKLAQQQAMQGGGGNDSKKRN